MLVGISTMLAMQTGHEELLVGEDEMTTWIGAAQKVARHYSVETTQKALDWTAFFGISAQVFGTRAMAIAVKSKNKPRRRNNVQPLHAVTPDIMPQTDYADI